MQVILDEREGTLFDKCSELIANKYVPTITSVKKEVLCLGDIVFRSEDGSDTIIIERKSLRDLLASIRDSRYEEQSYRLLHAGGVHPHKIIYIIEGMMSSLKNAVEKKTVYSAITSLNVFKGFSVIRTSNVSETAEIVLSMADKIIRNAKKKLFPWEPISTIIPFPINTITDISENLSIDGGIGEVTTTTIPISDPVNYCTVVKKVKKENVTVKNFGEIILCQVPGVSSISAIAIMSHFESPLHLIDSLRSDSSCLSHIKIETSGKSRKIGKNIVDNINKYLSIESK